MISHTELKRKLADQELDIETKGRLILEYLKTHPLGWDEYFAGVFEELARKAYFKNEEEGREVIRFGDLWEEYTRYKDKIMEKAIWP